MSRDSSARERRSQSGSPAGDRRIADPPVVGVAVVAATYLAVFFQLTNVVGGTARTAAVVAVAGLGGLALAQAVGERTALLLAGAAFVAGLSGYLVAVPESQRALFTVRSVALDILALSTGLSVLRLALADVWVLAVVPVPTFLVGYFAGRGRHVAAATVAGGTLGFLVLTGDADTGAAVAGVVGIALAVGLSTLSTPGRRRGHAGTFAVVVAAMVVASATVTVIPAGAAAPLGIDRGTTSLESSLSGDDELEVIGSTRLSPEVRYTVESPIERNWHTGAYDTYTGDGWVRTGERSALGDSLSGPPGPSESVSVSITAETESTALPAPWKPTAAAASGGGTVELDERGSLRLAEPLEPGEEATVESRVLDADPAALRNASTDYPTAIEERYTQLPESTPDRVGDRTEEIVAAADAESPYEQAAAVEAYLRSEYDYSLTVERPEGDIADAFLFEMDAGYCVYFATTMAAMLRSQGIPTRMETGYTSGQRVGEDEYVVRGQNAHAWVSIYVPDQGWVAFDPTPSDPRDEARQTRLAEARADGAENVDTEASTPNQTLEAGPSTGNPDSLGDESEPSEDGNDSTDPETAEENATNGTENVSEAAISRLEGAEANDVEAPGTSSDSGGGGLVPTPGAETVVYWLLVAALGVAGARRTGLASRASGRVAPVLPRRRGDPAATAERAFADLERLLAGRYRERRPGETPRSYVDAVRTLGADERIETVAAAYERAAYAGSVTREEADAARRAVRRLALERLPLVGRFVR
ncbi:Transglutaminase-like enzyme, putative cysteine protease [Halorubrum xinjiangense]|uniref:Transglutaminase-like enzyme, putative cysteine protease n=1 Tax=Halorubrum xinjiangense TaxID=261291 RepID=A0A1G7L7I6_9EURY|nr:transglutaminase domain-containing protein [Halorubrum xinjiangense]SDF45522.1 Transglutaminase-like enzyme, putative cysteine protease [Halorubrum xinjiangense]